MKLGDCESYYEKNSTAVCCTEVSLDENPGESNLPEYLKELWERSCIHLNENESTDFANLLKRYKNVFSKSSDDIGRTNLIQHEINTGNAVPIRQPPRRLPFGKRQIEKDEIQRMLKLGVIEPSTSSWSSPVVLIAKKGGQGGTRFCVDFRGVNGLMTEKIAYPIPRIDDCLDALSTASFYGFVHRPGLKHRNADALSRNPCASCSRQESVNNAHDSCDEDSEEKEQLSVRTVTRSKADTSPTRNQFVLLGWDVNTIRQQQLQDKIIGQLFIKFEDKEIKPEWNSLSDESSDLKTLWNMWDRFEICNGVLYVNWIDNLEQIHWRLIISSFNHWIYTQFPNLWKEVTLPLQAVIPMPSPAQDYATCKEDFVIDLQNRLQTVHELAPHLQRCSVFRDGKECWICPENLIPLKQLKSHLASSVHSKMEVVCPLFGQHTKYKRVWELKDNSNRFHKPAMQDMRPDVLSEGNAYYLAVHPACYRKVVRPTAFYSPSARDLKKAMQAWLKKSKDTNRTPEEWKQGWKEGTKFDGPPGEELFQPVYSGDETRAASSSSIDMEITRPEAWRITYVALVPQSIMVEAIFRRETYRFAIADTLLADVKYVSALTRRMLAIPQGGRQSAGRKHKLLGKTFSDRVTLAVKLLGLPEKYIKSIHRLETDFYAVPTTELFDPPSTCKTPVISKKKNIVKSTISAKKSTKKSSSSVIKKPEKPSSTQVTSSPRKSTPPTTPVQETRKPSSAPVTAITSKPSTPPTTPAVNTSISVLSLLYLPDPCHLYLLQQRSPRSPPYHTPQKSLLNLDQYIPTPKQLLATITTQDIPNLELHVRTPAERAPTLLRLGECHCFLQHGETGLGGSGETSWRSSHQGLASQGWKEMTPDTKKLNWEFIAFQYEQVSNHPTVPSRAGLLDKYNMLALPGTSPHNKIKDVTRTVMKNRFYLYEHLRLIATNGIKPDLSTTFMLDMLEKASASRDTSTDHICHALDKAGIPLRLDV
ncbi:unnamed protein product [Mytilus edulis]|uniref:Uncharacterized protein n=1 Tax=Mytilus edulis TaxID=6550 RepID=A0A8S3T523_MYTED|nr:unnamed protein product [Mytilus edulis]